MLWTGQELRVRDEVVLYQQAVSLLSRVRWVDGGINGCNTVELLSGNSPFAFGSANLYSEQVCLATGDYQTRIVMSTIMLISWSCWQWVQVYCITILIMLHCYNIADHKLLLITFECLSKDSTWGSLYDSGGHQLVQVGIQYHNVIPDVLQLIHSLGTGVAAWSGDCWGATYHWTWTGTLGNAWSGMRLCYTISKLSARLHQSDHQLMPGINGCNTSMNCCMVTSPFAFGSANLYQNKYYSDAALSKCDAVYLNSANSFMKLALSRHTIR